jgi:hypothetical protein
MRSVYLSAEALDSVAIEVQGVDASPSEFRAWIPSFTVLKAGSIASPKAATPLRGGELVRIVVNGFVTHTMVVNHQSIPMIYEPWPDVGLMRKEAFTLVGANLDLTSAIEWTWVPAKSLNPLPAVKTEAEPVQSTLEGTSLRVPALHIPNLPGSVTFTLLGASGLRTKDPSTLRIQ